MARKPMPWLRLYVELPHDRKIRRLRKGEYKWLYVCVLVLARQSPQPGHLLVSDNSPVDVEDLADLSGCDVKTCAAALDAMTDQGLIELDGDVIVVPAWESRQFASDDVAARSRKARKQQPKDVACNNDATLQSQRNPVACNAPETETENRDRTSLSPSTKSDPSDPLLDDLGALMDEALRGVA